MKKKLLLLFSAFGLSACFGIACFTGITKSRAKESKATSDLTNTTWVFNETLNTDSDNLFTSINFVSNNANYTSLTSNLDTERLLYDTTRVYSYASELWINEEYRTITITGGNDVANANLITWLNNNATLQTPPSEPDTPTQSYTFTFNNQINYYAPYQQNINSMFVSDSNMVTAGTIQSKTLLEGLTFVSGGQTFDTIKLYYISAEAQKFLTDTGTISTFTGSGFASYIYMVYINSETSTLVVVNNRDTPSYTDNSSTAIIQTKGSTWVSQSYRYIVISEAINDVTITNLGTLNNASMVTPSVTTNSDIGLGNVFVLLSNAFASWLPIMSIQLIPGITIGLLIFMPLIVGIIILIIWLVKR